MDLPVTDWESELPFLEWTTDDNGEPCVKLGFDGEQFGALCKDGNIIREGTDDRLKAYERFQADQLKNELQTAKDCTLDGFEHIRSAEDPFPVLWMLKRPRFVRWLEGMDDSYVPTVAEQQMAAAYADRKRRFREQARAGISDAKESTSYATPEELAALDKRMKDRQFFSKINKHCELLEECKAAWLRSERTLETIPPTLEAIADYVSHNGLFNYSILASLESWLLSNPLPSSEKEPPTPDDIARRYYELEIELGTNSKQKRYDKLSPMFEKAGIEHPPHHSDSRLKSILVDATKRGINRQSTIGDRNKK